MPQFEAAGAQVVGVSADHVATLEAWGKQNNVHYLLLSDFRRTMLPAYDALVTDDKSPIYRYAKRAYFVIDRQGSTNTGIFSQANWCGYAAAKRSLRHWTRTRKTGVCFSMESCFHFAAESIACFAGCITS